MAKELKSQVLIFKERAGKPGGGKGILIGDRASFTLSTLTDEAVCYAIDSHPGDSRFELSGGGVTPTLIVKIAKGSCDGPLVLIASDARGNVTRGGCNSPDYDR